MDPQKVVTPVKISVHHFDNYLKTQDFGFFWNDWMSRLLVFCESLIVAVGGENGKR